MKEGIHLQNCLIALMDLHHLIAKKRWMRVVYTVSFFFFSFCFVFLSLRPVSVIFCFSANHLIKPKGELLKFSVFPLAEAKSCRGGLRGGGREEKKKKKKDVIIFQLKRRRRGILSYNHLSIAIASYC